ncbi:MAG: Gfo/Idh/MocA family oxidoreductase [Syntrophobacter sp.]
MSGDLGVGIVGCGLIGEKRAGALGSAKLVACADLVGERARAMAQKYPHAKAASDWRDLLDIEGVDIVIVATTVGSLAEICEAALRAGKHVLVEKPVARSVRELAHVIEVAEPSGKLVRVGFNHRYHPAALKAYEIFSTGALGEMMFVRGRYGHGGRIGYDKEWRADPRLSGGGELIDQGVHLIDLARRFLGDFTETGGFAHTYFWEMPVDDNAFMLLKTAGKQAAFLHVSCTEWKNLFSFEIYGRDAKLHWEGLGGSYGVERLSYYKMLPRMGPPETMIWEYQMGDRSWELEFAEFVDDIRLNRVPRANLHDALAALEIVEKICRESGYDYYT